jgi:hypothetical protein
MYRREATSAVHGPVTLRGGQLPRELQLGLVSGPRLTALCMGYIMVKEASAFLEPDSGNCVFPSYLSSSHSV